MIKLSGFILLLFLVACQGQTEKVNESTPTDSIALLTAQLQVDPDNYTLLQKRATLYIEKQQGDSALQDLTSIIIRDSSDAVIYCLLADAYFLKGNFNASEHAISRALLLDPEHIGALTRKAEMYFYHRDYASCMSTIQQALNADRHNPRILFIRAMAYKESGDTGKAISDLERVIQQDMNYYNAYYQLGSIYAALNKLALAEGYFNNAAKLQPNNIEPLYALAMMYQQTGATQKAVSMYRTLLQVDKDFKYAYYNMGYISMLHEKSYTKAIALFDSACMIDNNYAEAYYNKAVCYELTGNKQMARTNYKKAITCRPDYTKAIEALNQLH